MTPAQAEEFTPLIRRALAEDAVDKDVTTLATIGERARVHADVRLRSAGVVAGLQIGGLAMKLVDERIVVEILANDGTRVDARTAVMRLDGPARGILSAERVALNFIGRLSGIATFTARFVDAVRGLPVRIADTRKTTPGMRALERYAVRAGGGFNHRFDLASAVLIKDNHLATGLTTGQAVLLARSIAAAGTIIEVECEDLAAVSQAVEAGADAVLLDNMPLEQMGEAVRIARGAAVIEASGGVTLENVRDVAATGVEIISTGALTHDAPWLDVGVDFAEVPERAR
ncbi:MAG: carboxylating nicotinate-nucleotide diphosphorylase [Candidatus Eremiobacteraeota bacterium]|nr:carboxylating nicotinate-nucleotide diphosphorylase [Candidatus Eremiobacteraeota bacterium]MBV8282903.1 carboxylating nicotinate-nucleotide diphosphorylase [Candidatus Eremiobacteraeota bacterium]